MKPLALSLLLLSPAIAGTPKTHPKKTASARFPLPLPKSYKMPPEIQDVVLFLYKKADSLTEFEKRYKLTYEDKDDLKDWLQSPLVDELDVAQMAFTRSFGKSYEAEEKVKYERVVKFCKDFQNW